MSNLDALSDAERLLGRFDLAAQLAARDQEHRDEFQGLLLSLVEVRDSFDRLFTGIGAAAPEVTEPARSWLGTVRLIAGQLDAVLRRVGVTRDAYLGRPAEPGRHEIVATREVAGTDEGIIIEEQFSGYTWNGQPLRKPRVVVARPPHDSPQE